MSNILRKQNKMIDMTPPADAYDVTYGNTTVGDELDGLTANKASTAVDISGYSTSSNKYVVPSDGYIYINNNTGQTGTAYAYGSNNNVCALVGGVEGRHSLFVRKGLKIFISGTVAGAYYYQLS